MRAAWRKGCWSGWCELRWNRIRLSLVSNTVPFLTSLVRVVSTVASASSVPDRASRRIDSVSVHAIADKNSRHWLAYQRCALTRPAKVIICSFTPFSISPRWQYRRSYRRGGSPTTLVAMKRGLLPFSVCSAFTITQRRRCQRPATGRASGTARCLFHEICRLSTLSGGLLAGLATLACANNRLLPEWAHILHARVRLASIAMEIIGQ